MKPAFQPPTIAISGVHTVGVIRWKGIPNDLHCVICENFFEIPCPNCENPGENCPPAFGACGHIFHLHCIGAWLNREGIRNDEEGNCPMCRQVWRFAAGQAAAAAAAAAVADAGVAAAAAAADAADAGEEQTEFTSYNEQEDAAEEDIELQIHPS
ncbi:hypothetical protein, conserved [Eimeria acervulina]|uniref:Anaphase-promoting complex subunit 11 n=1 Tax=Eimeria acervulina TaxID=5801 RepID=U6GHR7_EIMAC|nr:hypothetical protein, conserved [Eimeria acervulina]CDI79092.1 hypothetical protein, conserved [Eimeria acervulina]